MGEWGAEAQAHHGSRRFAVDFLSLSAISAALALPAVYNGFPLVFPDTSAYLAVAYADSWPIDRAGFYGLLLSPALLSLQTVPGLWFGIVLQAVIVGLVLLSTIRRLLPEASSWLAVGATSMAALLTTLPWHASQLLPDAFTGALVLLVWLSACRDLDKPGTILMWFATFLLGLVHYTHVGLILAGSTATFLVCGLTGTTLKEIGKRALAATMTTVAVLAAHTAVYGFYFDRWQPSPLGGYFLFARLNEDGLVPLWMDRHCGKDAPKPLCDLRPSLPRDSQALLWGKTPSPLHDRINKKAGQPESWPWVDMVSEAARGSIKEQPFAFASNAAVATVDQFLHYQALDDECPENCRNLKMFEWRPVLIDPVRASRQLTGGLPRNQIRNLTTATSTIGLLFLLPLFVFATRRRDSTAQAVLLTTGACLLVNAAMAGALSDVHDRYQSRLVWLAPFLMVILMVRWRKFRNSLA